MIEAATAVADLVGKLLSGQRFMVRVLTSGSLFWVATLSFLLGRQPTELIDATAHWLGDDLSTAPIAAWIQAREIAVVLVALSLIMIAIAGARAGGEMWTRATHGPAAMVAGAVLLLQTQTTLGPLVLGLAALAIVVGVADRSIVNALSIGPYAAAYLALAPIRLVDSLLPIVTRGQTVRPSSDLARPSGSRDALRSRPATASAPIVLNDAETAKWRSVD